MNQLIFYVKEKQLHDGKQMHEWLLEEAREIGILGGSAFRAIAGFGRHGRLREEIFFELAGELSIRVEFIVDDKLAEQIIQRVRAQGMNIFYMRHKVESGFV